MNHAYITVKRNLNAEDVETQLNQIVKKIWQGAVKVVNNGKDRWKLDGGGEGWGGFPYGLSVWLDSKRKIGFRRAPGDWGGWAQYIVQESLAQHYNGTCSDEGVSERWNGEPSKYPNLKSYIDMIMMEVSPSCKLSNAEKNARQKLAQDIYDSYSEHVPDKRLLG